MKFPAVFPAAGLVVVLLNQVILAGGPLTPPGPPAETMRSLTEIEPRTPINPADLPISIDQPGNYYLTGSSSGGGGAPAITVNSGGVTVDLGDWTLENYGTAIRIAPSSSDSRVTVRNGYLRNGSTGIYSDSGVGECRIEGVTISEFSTGIYSAMNTLVVGCRIYSFSTGIRFQNSGQVENCRLGQASGSGVSGQTGILYEGSVEGFVSDTTVQNFDTGIRMFSGTIRRVFLETPWPGTYGINFEGSPTSKGIIEDSTIKNFAEAIDGNQLLAKNVTITAGNSLSGPAIICSDDSIIRECVITDYTNGLQAELYRRVLVDRSIFKNDEANGTAIELGSDGAVRESVVSGFGSGVVLASRGGSIDSCSITNCGTGIQIQDQSTVKNNQFGEIQSVAVWAYKYNQVIDNTMSGSGSGVFVTTTGSGNLIIRNSVTKTGNGGGNLYQTGSSDLVGPIVSGSGVITNTVPSANFSP